MSEFEPKEKIIENASILIVDDEIETLEIFSRQLSGDFDVDTVQSAYLALEMMKKKSYHIALTDLVMPGEDGLELLASIKKEWPNTAVIVISGKASIDMAVKAMKLGAEEFIEKPIEDLQIMEYKIRNILKAKWQSEEIKRLKAILTYEFDRSHIVGNSYPIQSIMEKVKKIAPLDATIFISGETGVGKELFADLVYRNSNRSNKKFVAVNCGGIPETLLESMLFGHVKGAFTGAVKDKIGYFQEADGGTLFLDEVTETSLTFQIKLLRVLEKGVIRQVGGERDISVNVRIIAASNKNLEDEVQKGNFREDLYYRLNVIGINIPPLRERPEDIQLLAIGFAKEFGKKYNKLGIQISERVMTVLLTRDWKGNVRELKNSIEHAVALASHENILLEDLPSTIYQHRSKQIHNRSYDNLTFAEAKEIFERGYIEKLLEVHKGDVTKAAKFSKIQRENLYVKFKKLKIDPKIFREKS